MYVRSFTWLFFMKSTLIVMLRNMSTKLQSRLRECQIWPFTSCVTMLVQNLNKQTNLILPKCKQNYQHVSRTEQLHVVDFNVLQRAKQFYHKKRNLIVITWYLYEFTSFYDQFLLIFSFIICRSYQLHVLFSE